MAALILTPGVALESCFRTSLPSSPVAPVTRTVLEFLLIALPSSSLFRLLCAIVLMLLEGGCNNLVQDFHISFAPYLFEDSFHALLIFLEFQRSCSFHANTWEKPVHNFERTLEPQNGQLQFVYIKYLRVLFGSI